MPRRLTKEQIDYIKEHINDFPRKDIATKVGISTNALYRYIKMLGGAKKKRTSEETIERIGQLYPTMTAKEVATSLGITVSSVVWHASKLGVRHNEETKRRIDHNKALSLRKYWNEEKYIKKGRKHHLKYKMDELRVMSGMPQETNLRLRKLSDKALNAKMYLRKSHNYFYSKSEPFVLCYDKDTKRSKKESYYTDKFGFIFVNA